MIEKKGTSDPLGLVWAIIVFPALAVGVVIFTPILVGEMVTAHKFSNAEAGYVMSAEFLGMLLAALTSYCWLGKTKTSHAAKFFVVLSAVGNFVSALLTLSSVNFTELLVLRLLVGAPNGAIMVICLSSIAGMRNVERGYAQHLLGQIAMGGIGVIALPFLFKISGLYAAYFIMGLMISLAYPLAKAFPSLHLPPLHFSLAAFISRRNRSGLLALLGLLLFYSSLMGVWTYAERIGVASGISVVTIGSVLAITTVCGVIGAGAASFIAGKTSLSLMILLGMMLVSVAVFMLSGQHTLISFSVTISIAKFSWSFVLPFILGLITRIDHSKRLVISSYIVIKIGATIGPALAAARLGSSADYDKVVTSSLWLIAASTLVLLFVTLKTRVHTAEPLRNAG